MSLWIQHTLVLLIVAAAAILLLRHAIASLRGRGGKLGSCCEKGCTAAPQTPQHADRIAFIPVESLGRSRRL